MRSALLDILGRAGVARAMLDQLAPSPATRIARAELAEIIRVATAELAKRG